jgi:acetyl-CoA carboxylase carboxyl transferase subunit alpha
MNRQSYDSQVADYIDLIFDTFLELHGDRKSGDDSAVIGGLARLNGYKVVVTGYQRIRSVETLKAPGPEGYRKCLRLIHLAEAFSKPVIMFIDIPVGLSLPALEQPQANEAIARSLEEMSRLTTPIIGIIIGESSGIMAIDMCAVDCVLMLEGAGCLASLLGGTPSSGIDTSPSYLKAQDLLDLNVVHRIVERSSTGDIGSAANALREAISEELRRLTQIHPEVLVRQRLHRLQYQFLNLGSFKLTSGNADNII